MYDLTVVIPTFNEKSNVRPLFQVLQTALMGQNWEAVYVDDDSPDGTADEVRALASEVENVRVLHRKGRRGLSGACIEGILSSTSEFCAVIDADLQHDEKILPQMLGALQKDETLDLVIGSRNISGGSSGDGLSPIRKWGSDQATSITRRLLKIEASDPMSGFFMVRRLSFNQIVTTLQSEGFKILADMLAASSGRWNILEIPYTFRERHSGDSKMSTAVTLEFLSLLLARLSGGLVSIRFVLFAAVGFSGIFVQLAAMKLVLSTGQISFVWAQTFGVFVAINSNFIFNNLITFRDHRLKGSAFFKGLFSFYLVCAFGALVNIGIANIVYSTLSSSLFASLCGAIAGALWNFIASSLFTWKTR